MTVIESALRGLVRLVFIAIAIPLGAWAADGTDSEWPTYGNDPGGTRYAPLTQVTRANVAQLTQVWSYRTGDLGEGFPSNKRMAFEATPILIDGVLYVSTPYGHVHAIRAATGEAVVAVRRAPAERPLVFARIRRAASARGAIPTRRPAHRARCASCSARSMRD